MDHRGLLIREAPRRFTLNCLDKLRKSAVRHFELIHIKTVEEGTMDRLLVVITLVAPHRELTGWNEHHGNTIFSGDFDGQLRWNDRL